MLNVFHDVFTIKQQGVHMAKNTGNGYRKGSVCDRTQTQNPRTGLWTKRDAETGRFMDVKQNGEPFKGVAQEQDGRRSNGQQ